MPLPADTGGTARIRMVAVLERGRSNARVLPVRLNGSAVTVSSGTYTLRAPTGAAVVDAAAVTGAAGSASYTVASGSLPSTLGYGDGYVEEWALTLSTGQAPIYRVPAVLARRALHCPVLVEDMESRVPNLSRAFGSLAGLQTFVDEAWVELVEHLIRATRFPEAVVDVDALRSPALYGALALAFRALAGSGGQQAGEAAQQAQHYESAVQRERALIRVRTDEDQDGVADSEVRRSIGHIMRGSAGPWSAVLPRSGGW